MRTKKLWCNSNIDVVEIDGKWYALSGWNGEEFCDCWETDSTTLECKSRSKYYIRPIYEEDGDQFNIVDYKIM